MLFNYTKWNPECSYWDRRSKYQVAGNGIKKLIEAGINVTVGVLEAECYELNKRFFLSQ
jgi:pyrimidine deaminase RibD-like protein